MFCSNCGFQNPDNATTCANCNMPLTPVQYAQPNSMYSQPAYAPQPQKKPGKGFGIAGMILGILACLYALIFIGMADSFTSYSYYYGYSSVDEEALFTTFFIFAQFPIAGLIFSGIGNGRAKSARATNGMAVAGLVCSIIALSIMFITLIASL